MNERIFVVEDDLNIQDIMKLSLQSSGYDVVLFDNPLDFFKRLKEETPDLAIFDLLLPKMDGMSAIKKLRENNKTLPILVVSAKDREIDKVYGLDGGCDDYMTKPFSILELCARVRALLRRTNQKETIIKTPTLYLDKDKHLLLKNNEVIELTHREYQLFVYLIDNRDRVVTRNELLDRIWGYTFSGESRVLDAQIKSLRHKLGDDGVYIQTIRSVGYRFIEC